MRTLFFTVERLELVEAGKFMIAGRNCGDDLQRGDRLRVHDASGLESSAEFYVDEISLYGRAVTAVAHGYTAVLLFPNDLAPHVRLGNELRGQVEG